MMLMDEDLMDVVEDLDETLHADMDPDELADSVEVRNTHDWSKCDNPVDKKPLRALYACDRCGCLKYVWDDGRTTYFSNKETTDEPPCDPLLHPSFCGDEDE